MVTGAGCQAGDGDRHHPRGTAVTGQVLGEPDSASMCREVTGGHREDGARGTQGEDTSGTPRPGRSPCPLGLMAWA